MEPKEVWRTVERKKRHSIFFWLLLVFGCMQKVEAQSDPSQILQQLNELQQQMAGASDPCPLMPKLKSLINQIADQSPDIYKAMKPSLDILNSQDDGCKADTHASPNPGGIPSGVSTGTAPPANCVYLSDAQPCVPVDQYNRRQTQIAAAPVSVSPPTTLPTPWPAVATNANFVAPDTPNTHICPSVGHILTGHYAETDLWEGETIPCTPGQQVIITWPRPTRTGLSPNPSPGSGSGSGGPSSDGSGTGGDSGSAGSAGGGSNGHGPIDPNLNYCIGYAYNKDNFLVLTNNCSVAAHVLWYASQSAYGGVYLDPGGSDNTYNAYRDINAAGGFSLYACPSGDYARKSDGSIATMGLNNSFACTRN